MQIIETHPGDAGVAFQGWKKKPTKCACTVINNPLSILVCSFATGCRRLLFSPPVCSATDYKELNKDRCGFVDLFIVTIILAYLFLYCFCRILWMSNKAKINHHT